MVALKDPSYVMFRDGIREVVGKDNAMPAEDMISASFAACWRWPNGAVQSDKGLWIMWSRDNGILTVRIVG